MKILNDYYSQWKDSTLLNEQQVPGGVGNAGNIWQICGTTPGPNGGLGGPWPADTLPYGSVFTSGYGANGFYIPAPNYWVPDRCNDSICTAAHIGMEFETDSYQPNHPNAARWHVKLIAVGGSTPTVTNVCNYGQFPPQTNLYDCPHYYTNWTTGNCVPDPAYGCTDPNATNYDPVATVDDGSCVSSIPGCTDPTANNYDPLATVDDGSCTFTDTCHYALFFGPTCDNPMNFPGWDAQSIGQIGSTTGPFTPGVDVCLGCNGNMCVPSDIGQPFAVPSNNLPGVIAILDSYSNPTYGPMNSAISATCPLIPGCMNPMAINYDPLAQIDDGSCIIYGCTDSQANNYDPNATIDDGSCTYDVLGCMDVTATNYDPNATIDDGSCFWEGCTDPLAVNYLDNCAGNSVPNANVDDGCCDFLGCTDPAASNYDPNATIDDGSCVFPTVGCTDPTATNYNPIATVDDGSCFWEGCTDPTATNYDPTATVDDGSCIYPVYGCTDPLATNYNSLATIDDGSCIYPIPGCTDPLAFNYDPTATVDDGSCLYDGCTDPNATNFNPSANADCSGVVGGPDTSCCIYPIPGCPANNVVGPIMGGGGTCNTCELYNPLAVGCPDGNGLAVPGDHSCCCLLGCIDPLALNFDPFACIDDGSCQMPPPLDCTCCDIGQPGQLNLPMGMMIPYTSPIYSQGCVALNGNNYTNCDNTQTFNPSDCDPDCTTFDFTSATSQSTSLGPGYNMIMDAYNLGLTNGQAHGIMDGNSIFCVEYCGMGGNTDFPCDCCGEIHDCDQDWLWPKPFGCWTCRTDIDCGQPSVSWMTNNNASEFYNTEADCLLDAPIECPPKPTCDNTPDFCSTTPSLTPGGSCWICHHGHVCLPVYDYLEYGSGPPGSTGTYSFMMNWLIPQNTTPTQTYQTPQGSSLFCNAQDCMANSPCNTWEVWNNIQQGCDPPPSGCPAGEVWWPYPKCECALPKVVGPVDKKKDKEKEDIKKIDFDESGDPIKEEFTRMRTIWKYEI